MNWCEVYQRLMGEPHRLSLEQIGGLTDHQIIGLFTEPGRHVNHRAKKQALAELDRFKRETFKESFVRMRCNGDTSQREKYEKEFDQQFPNDPGV